MDELILITKEIQKLPPMSKVLREKDHVKPAYICSSGRSRSRSGVRRSRNQPNSPKSLPITETPLASNTAGAHADDSNVVRHRQDVVKGALAGLEDDDQVASDQASPEDVDHVAGDQHARIPAGDQQEEEHNHAVAVVSVAGTW
ncbi:hypothetical protein KIN20_026097 [Parelaphostrongylus tenuis]|uniref:Uncharacterized protein n=1 Tax=Parelaphostrongylus tenuis TaxID=148309 RepID=A0AAD5MWB1_PARTN|nr:hypothetical protein KIN20_026097 [Parelaphostrongylus tenuis]